MCDGGRASGASVVGPGAPSQRAGLNTAVEQVVADGRPLGVVKISDSGWLPPGSGPEKCSLSNCRV